MTIKQKGDVTMADVKGELDGGFGFGGFGGIFCIIIFIIIICCCCGRRNIF